MRSGEGGRAGPIRTASIVGARPQFVKLAPVSARNEAGTLKIEDRIVHTGQHYDEAMSKIFFEELEIPPPRVNFGDRLGLAWAPDGTHARSHRGVSPEDRPDAVMVYGDTNSTLAGALAAAKLYIPVVHVEAGLRSFNRRMPEELNRIAKDQLPRCCWPERGPPSRISPPEGLPQRAFLTGDVMYDAVLFNAKGRRAAFGNSAHMGLRGGNTES